MADELIDALVDIVGAGQVLTGGEQAERYLTEWRGAFKPRAAAIVRPADVDEISRVLAVAARFNAAIVAQAGNTGTVGGSAADDPRRQVILNLQRLNRVREIDADNATITVEAGCTLADAQRAADNAGFYLPIQLASAERCRIGGNLATNAGGLNVVHYGNTRDLVLGLEVVLADGRVWDNLTGLRKDNSGYDLNDLFVGSEGTLGIISAAVLELADPPRQRAVAFCALADVQSGVALQSRLQRETGRHVVGCELISAQALTLACDYSAECRMPFTPHSDWYLLAEVAISAAGDWLIRACESTLAEAARQGLIVNHVVADAPGAMADLWRLRTSIPPAQSAAGASIKHDISLPVSKLPAFIADMTPRLYAAVSGIRPCIFGHIGDGNLHFNLTRPVDMSDTDFRAHEAGLHRLVHDRVAALRGSIAAEHGVGRLKVDEIVRLKAPVEIDMLRAVKKALDPDNRLNPGAVVRI
ncbi:FAD-binding oxidoreductase [Salinisphaera sp.]|uniref:FAD-binding oxidoreductase n=1 Tax=Salinisphaera sp. TaxID=1914330 RepID=UPI002D792D18|nr:FAD-binding oxidoreductase [Salinisphaera sp.]HET7314817.1 FAD-binding oxidoreductase [Salinisphaera sp.]